MSLFLVYFKQTFGASGLAPYIKLAAGWLKLTNDALEHDFTSSVDRTLIQSANLYAISQQHSKRVMRVMNKLCCVVLSSNLLAASKSRQSANFVTWSFAFCLYIFFIAVVLFCKRLATKNVSLTNQVNAGPWESYFDVILLCQTHSFSSKYGN